MGTMQFLFTPCYSLTRHLSLLRCLRFPPPGRCSPDGTILIALHPVQQSSGTVETEMKHRLQAECISPGGLLQVVFLLGSILVAGRKEFSYILLVTFCITLFYWPQISGK